MNRKAFEGIWFRPNTLHSKKWICKFWKFFPTELIDFFWKTEIIRVNPYYSPDKIIFCSKCCVQNVLWNCPKWLEIFFLVNVFMNLILVIHHVFKIGLKPDFSVFKKITKSLPSGFFNSPWGKTFRIRILFWSAKYLVWTIPSKTFLFNPT